MDPLDRDLLRRSWNVLRPGRGLPSSSNPLPGRSRTGSASDWGRPASEGWDWFTLTCASHNLSGQFRTEHGTQEGVFVFTPTSGRGHVNDPSAGSPTETLLRLLLPLNATVWSSSRQPGRVIRQANSPRTSLKRSIGSSDGRCVQRAGT